MTNENLKLATGIVGLVAAHTLLSLPLRKKNRRLTQDLNTLIQLNIFQSKYNAHLSTILDENDITPTEFDIIVLNDLIK